MLLSAVLPFSGQRAPVGPPGTGSVPDIPLYYKPQKFIQRTDVHFPSDIFHLLTDL